MLFYMEILHGNPQEIPPYKLNVVLKASMRTMPNRFNCILDYEPQHTQMFQFLSSAYLCIGVPDL